MSKFTDAELKEANEKLSSKLREVENLVGQCTEIADTYGLDFHFDPTGTYGMGGWYTAKPVDGDEDEWCESDYGWQASSNSC